MFKIAKSKDVKNEQINIELKECEYIDFRDKKTHKSNDLIFEINGNSNNKEISINFIISKPINEYMNIKNNDKIKIDQKNIVDAYMNIGKTTYLDIIIDITVYRIDYDLLFVIIFRDYDNNYFGNVEVNYDISNI